MSGKGCNGKIAFCAHANKHLNAASNTTQQRYVQHCHSVSVDPTNQYHQSNLRTLFWTSITSSNSASLGLVSSICPLHKRKRWNYVTELFWCDRSTVRHYEANSYIFSKLRIWCYPFNLVHNRIKRQSSRTIRVKCYDTGKPHRPRQCFTKNCFKRSANWVCSCVVWCSWNCCFQYQIVAEIVACYFQYQKSLRLSANCYPPTGLHLHSPRNNEPVTQPESVRSFN